MAKKRGSSTRKYKIPIISPTKAEKTKKVTTPQPIKTTKEQQLEMIQKLELVVKSGKSKQGKDLTNNEISTFLTTIANLEHKLGIKHV